jgi:hypothetical protein
MFRAVLKDIAEDNELQSGTLRLLSLIFLLIAATLSLLQYTRPTTWYEWVSSSVSRDWWPFQTPARSAPINFRPDLVNGLIALALVAPLYMRGILKWKTSIYSIISFSLILLVFASLVTMALGGGGTKDSFIRGALLSAVVLSWLGIRSVAGIAWLLALGCGIYTVNRNSIAMGFPGFLYVTSGTLGLLLHSGLNPGDLLRGLSAEYWPASRRALEASRADVNALGHSVGRITETAARIGLPRT